MEPPSNAQDGSSTDEPMNGPAAYVCRVCEESIPPAVDRQWREALVHRGCLAALRCGISLGSSGSRRVRERDRR